MQEDEFGMILVPALLSVQQVAERGKIGAQRLTEPQTLSCSFDDHECREQNQGKQRIEDPTAKGQATDEQPGRDGLRGKLREQSGAHLLAAPRPFVASPRATPQKP
jgi:hypothetical protein